MQHIAMTMIIIIVNDVTKSLLEGRVWGHECAPSHEIYLVDLDLNQICKELFCCIIYNRDVDRYSWQRSWTSPFTFYILKRFHKIASFRSLLKAMCCFATLRVFFEWKLSGLAASSVISGGIWVRKDLTKYSSLSLMRDLKCNPKYSEQSFRIWEYQSD